MSKYKVSLHWDERTGKEKGAKYPGRASLTVIVDAPNENVASSTAEAMNPGYKKSTVCKA